MSHISDLDVPHLRSTNEAQWSPIINIYLCANSIAKMEKKTTTSTTVSDKNAPIVEDRSGVSGTMGQMGQDIKEVRNLFINTANVLVY